MAPQSVGGDHSHHPTSQWFALLQLIQPGFYVIGARDISRRGGSQLARPFFQLIQLGSQLEGCVIDDDAGRMFVGEENVGLWVVNLESEDMIPQRIDTVGSGTGLVADVEGVSLYAGADGRGYVVVSAQSKDRFVIYDRKPPHAHAGVITVTANANGAVDGVSHTDGLDVSSAPLPGLPAGILVVQDDANPISEIDQNFKIIDWREVERALAAAKAAQ
jgi:3-phytase